MMSCYSCDKSSLIATKSRLAPAQRDKWLAREQQIGISRHTRIPARVNRKLQECWNDIKKGFLSCFMLNPFSLAPATACFRHIWEATSWKKFCSQTISLRSLQDLYAEKLKKSINYYHFFSYKKEAAIFAFFSSLVSLLLCGRRHRSHSPDSNSLGRSPANWPFKLKLYIFSTPTFLCSLVASQHCMNPVLL